MVRVFKQIAAQIRAYPEVLGILIRHRQMVWEMARREASERYSGQILGTFWTIAHPAVQVAIYLFLFVLVFKVKIGGTASLPLDYTTYLLAGLLPWLGIQEALVKSSSAVTNNSALVKQVVFPLEILPAKTVLTSMFTVVVSLAILTLYILVRSSGLSLMYALLPVLLVVQLIWMLGMAFILASIGTFIRDTKDIIQVAALVCQFLLPIFYLPSAVPEVFRPILYFNPYSYLIWCYQDVLYFGRFEHWWAWIVAPSLSLFLFGVGYRLFRKTKTLFGNIL